MAEKKITKRERFMELINLVNVSEVESKSEMVAFLEHEIELLERKSSSSAKTKTQQEHEKIMALIVEELGKVGKPVTVTELIKESVVMAEYSNQKLSSLLKKLTEAENPVVVKTIEKKKSYFSLKNRG